MASGIRFQYCAYPFSQVPFPEIVDESVLLNAIVEPELVHVIPPGSNRKDASCVLNQVLRGLPSNAVKESSLAKLVICRVSSDFRGNMKFTNMDLDERFDSTDMCPLLFWGPRAYLSMSFTVIINVDFHTWTAYRFGQRYGG
ncbi:hypothetical protein L6164_015216 [Bauhinia variegata]|uniref:Uncharacterized protein n=1 Tax=Bauhinia variegata TaxID=167791 RepID=A0ACB9NPQ8_BAUVA|nr:hypothetical protein L6164_015216 [Bauhinia variegata]